MIRFQGPRLAGAKNSLNSRGFTLIEALLAVSLGVAVFLALGASFIQGMKICRRIESMRSEEENGFFFERVTKDLKNFIPSVSLPAELGADRLYFTTLVPEITEPGAEPVFSPRRVEYRFNPEKKEVTRSESEFLFGEKKPKFEIVARGVRSVSFDVLSLGGPAPKHVGVTLRYLSASGAELEYKKIVPIPVSYVSDH